MRLYLPYFGLFLLEEDGRAWKRNPGLVESNVAV